MVNQMDENIAVKAFEPMKYVDQQQVDFIKHYKYSKRRQQNTLYCTRCCHRHCWSPIKPRNSNKSLKKQKGRNKEHSVINERRGRVLHL